MAVNTQAVADQKYKKAKSSFMRKGLTYAILSGMFYACYSACLTVGEGWGAWGDWWGLGLAGTALGYTFLCAVGAGFNDLCSGIWSLITACIKGKIGDYFRTLKTKPGVIMMCCGVVGGPIATTAYCVGLMSAGGIVAAISALCAAIGAILGRILFKQELNLRMIVGILICFAAAVIIGGTAFLSEGTNFVGCLVAFIAALGWGVEGCIGGFGTALIDFEISITLRQTTSGLVNLLILVPILCLMGKGLFAADGISNPYAYFVGGTIASVGVLWFVASGFFAMPGYSFWYKGNSMCGAALGMTCNAMYSFWVPLAMFILCDCILPACGVDGFVGNALTPIQWIMAVVEVFGIWLIAMNPLDLFKKEA